MRPKHGPDKTYQKINQAVFLLVICTYVDLVNHYRNLFAILAIIPMGIILGLFCWLTAYIDGDL